MDIPAPKKSDEPEETKISVAIAGDKPEPAVESVKKQESDIKSPDLPTDDAKSKAEKKPEVNEEALKIAELISSKKYVLGIKEKRTTPLLTFGFAPKKKKSKKKHSKKHEKTKTKSDPKASAKGRQKIQLVILAVLVIGFVVAMDAGLVDIGVSLPFDLIKT